MKKNTSKTNEPFITMFDCFFRKHYILSCAFIVGGLVFLAVVGLPHGLIALFTKTK